MAETTLTAQEIRNLTPEDVKERLQRLPQVRRWRQGNYAPGDWLTGAPGEAWGSWGRVHPPTKRGVSFVDINRARPEAIPDEGDGRTVDREGGALPSARRYHYPLNKKYQVWSANVESLYEEAVSRQWSATKDIPWDQLEPLPPDLERALCQLLTFLHAVEFVPTESLPYYMARIDPAFPEARQFLVTQCADEARHLEVFGKRLMANGGGPGAEGSAPSFLTSADPDYQPLPPDVARRAAGARPDWDMLAYCYNVQVLGEAVVLDMFRFGEFLGRNPCDKMIFRRVMQDEARHVSYGTMHIKYYLENAPKEERARALELLHFQASANEAGAGGFNLLINPRVIEPFALLAAGSVAEIDRGWQVVREFWAQVVQDYLERCDRAGFPRWDKCLMPREAPF